MFATRLLACIAVVAAVLPGWVLAAEANSGLDVATDDACVSVFWNGKAVFKYRYADAPPKPYVVELYTPGGTQILRDSPADHVHHRGLMYGVMVDGVDFWGEQPAAGKQLSASLQASAEWQNGRGRSRLKQRVEWVAAGKTLALESRTIDVWAGGDLPATLLTWRTALQPASGLTTIQVTGTHYDGLGMRFVQSMDGVGRFFNPTGDPGKSVRGTERVAPAPWCAYTAPVGEKPVTVALFDHPQNVRHPAGMFTMLQPFSYLSATPNVWNNPLAVAQGSSLDHTYGVALWDGETTAAAVAELYERWVSLAKR